MGSAAKITTLLSRMSQHPAATEALMTMLYDELRALAAHYLAGQRPDHTLQPTALVNEAYLRLLGSGALEWSDRAHFFSVAAMAMRQILVNHAAARQSLKRGAGFERVTLSEAMPDAAEQIVDLVALDDALSELEQLDARQARVVEMRYFAGLAPDQIAHVLGVSKSTVEKDWRMARLWLLRRLAA